MLSMLLMVFFTHARHALIGLRRMFSIRFKKSRILGQDIIKIIFRLIPKSSIHTVFGLCKKNSATNISCKFKTTVRDDLYPSPQPGQKANYKRKYTRKSKNLFKSTYQLHTVHNLKIKHKTQA
jgi:hypothetical protein